MLVRRYKITLVFIIVSILMEWLIPEVTGKVFLIDLLGLLLAFFILRDLRAAFRLKKIKTQIQKLRYFFAALTLFFLALRFLPLLSMDILRESLWDRAYFHAALFTAFLYSILPSRHFLRFILRFKLTPARMAFVLFSIFLVGGAFLLLMPWSLNPGTRISFIDAFFISTSALTITGLTSVNVAQTFNLFGQIVILLLIQIGALGVISFGFALSFFTQKRLSMSGTLVGQQVYDIQHIGDLYPFLKKVLFFTLIFEAIGAVLIYFLLPSETPYRGFSAVFHSVASFCNAGFSTFESGLVMEGHYILKTVVALFVILGSLGFPIFFEIFDRYIRKKKRGRKTFTPYFLMTVRIYFFLFFAGIIGVFITQIGSPLSAQQSLWNQFFDAFFYSTAARSSGFSVSGIEQYPHTTHLLLIFLMVIGGASVSTAGGIRVSTVGIVLASAWSMIKGLSWIQYQRSEINVLYLQKAVTVIVVYFLLAFFGVFFILLIEDKDAWALTFEVFSALSTVGLSLGVTSQLSAFSKLILMGLMICGRLGILLLLSIGISKVMEQRFRYPKERYFIG